MIALPCAPQTYRASRGIFPSKFGVVGIANVRRRTKSNGRSPPCCIVNKRKHEFIIDADDLPLVSGFKWGVQTTRGLRYAVGRVRRSRRRFSLHRLLVAEELIADHRLVVDHINGNGLDNRRSNIRVCTHAENIRNRARNKNCSSGFKGVRTHVRKTITNYEANIRAHGVKYYLGRFATPEAAHAAYVEAAKRLHGEFARAA